MNGHNWVPVNPRHRASEWDKGAMVHHLNTICYDFEHLSNIVIDVLDQHSCSLYCSNSEIRFSSQNCPAHHIRSQSHERGSTLHCHAMSRYHAQVWANPFSIISNSPASSRYGCTPVVGEFTNTVGGFGGCF